MKALFGALAAAVCVLCLAATYTASAQAAFGFDELDVTFEREGSAPATEAGSHPFVQNTVISFNTEENPSLGYPVPAEDLKDLTVSLPPGLVADTTAVPRCSNAAFVLQKCEPANQLGVNEVTFDNPAESGSTQIVPVYNLPPAPGTVARFGFVVLQVPITIEVQLNQHPPYNGIVLLRDTPEAIPIYRSRVTIWGTPADPVHNSERTGCTSGCVLGPEEPFLTLPTSCQGPVTGGSFEAVSWKNPLAPPVVGESTSSLELDKCEELEFDPQIQADPTTIAGDSPSGLDFDLEFDPKGLVEPDGRSQSAVEKTVVTLPEGVSTNPAAASGLGACTIAQYESETVDSAPGTGCPQSSKVGTVEIESPLVEQTIQGAIYVAKQGENPFGNLLTIYMVAKNPELGLLVQAAGKVDPNPTTGQLTTTFDDLPQLPFSRFHLHFRAGDRAPLITPALCGTYSADAVLYPYSAPSSPVNRAATFQVNSGANGAPCSSTPSALPHAPSFSAGTLSPVAGSYSPFVLRLNRPDGSQQLSAISATLPPGLVGKLAGIPYCSEAQIAMAVSRGAEGSGAIELASPSCPLASEVGTATVGAGAGNTPYYVQGHAYLAGPYKGGPLSLVIVTPAIAGPFDLGVVTVRTALQVDPTTARISAVSDPIPTILHGLPLAVRSVAVDMSRPQFMLNPTSCEPSAVTGVATSTIGAQAQLSSYFQASSCGSLGFKPKLSLRLKGGTKRDAHPALTTVLTARPGDANVGRASVLLPHSLFIDPDHINNPCTRAQYSAGQCPQSSILGSVAAYSPLLDEPLQGPIIFRSNGGERELPDIVFDLNGQIHIVQIGVVDSKHERIRTRFTQIPDAPLSKVVIKFKSGKKQGLLVNSANLCAEKQRARVGLAGHNGLSQTTTPVITTSCKKQR